MELFNCQTTGILSEKLHSIRFLQEHEKVSHCIAFVCKSDIIPIRKQGGENHGKNGEYQCPY